MTLDRHNRRGPLSRSPGEPGAHPNVGTAERWISTLSGAALLGLGLRGRALPRTLALLGGGYLVYRGASGNCFIYRGLGISTAPGPFAVSQEQGVYVTETMIINEPPEMLYRFWRRLENLPRFLSHLEEVRPLSDTRSHWVVQGPLGSKLSWDAEIVGDIENEVISWRSLPGADVPNAGAVRFRAIDEGDSTVMRVSLRYNPPGGIIGAAVARLFGDNPARTVRDDLYEFKDLMEHGRLPGRGPVPEEVPAEHAPDPVLEASEESFPASDPPSFSPGRIGGRHPGEKR